MGQLTAFYCNNFLRGGALDSTAYARGFSLSGVDGDLIYFHVQGEENLTPN